MQLCSDRSHKILTIPNLLSAFRLVLAGVFAYIYWNAKDQQDYNLAVGVLVLSGLTDFADGKIARRFHMISELGKVLDPIADKLTQAVVACCLAKHYGPMKLLFLVLVIKEMTQGIYGAYAVKKAGKNDGAMWCGKVTTPVKLTYQPSRTSSWAISALPEKQWNTPRTLSDHFRTISMPSPWASRS